jgi:phthalate 4,5-dioxygenase
VAAAKALGEGAAALGTTEPHIPHVKLSSFEGIVPKTSNWRTLGVSPEEIAMHAQQERAAS